MILYGHYQEDSSNPDFADCPHCLDTKIRTIIFYKKIRSDKGKFIER